MTKEKEPHLFFLFYDSISEENIKEVYKRLESDKLDLKVEKFLSQVRNHAEYLLPTAIMILIARPYFEGFLKEMGKSHYQALNKFIKEKIVYSRSIKFNLITKDGIIKTNQNQAISIGYQLQTGQKIIVLFDERLTDNEWITAFDKIENQIQIHYRNYPNDPLTHEIFNLDYKEKKIFALIDPLTHNWIFYDSAKISTLKVELERWENID